MPKNKLASVMDARELKPYWLISNAGISSNTAYRFYNDKDYFPSGETVESVCRALGVDVGDLFTIPSP